jgi:undecaprenyl diphosphate synthase
MSSTDSTRLHVGIIMDGNGRWASARGLPRTDGHRRGAAVVTEIIEAAADLGVGTLTLYAFSADNWRRPSMEVRTLLAIFAEYLASDLGQALARGVRFSLIGRRDHLPPALRRSAELVERTTTKGQGLHVRIAIDYSARESIWLAVERAVADGGVPSRDVFVKRLRSGRGELADVPDVDLLIRTGGEQRLSDFLLWESAYAELWFTDVAWPDFAPAHLSAALEAFSHRERRYGGLAPAVSQ